MVICHPLSGTLWHIGNISVLHQHNCLLPTYFYCPNCSTGSWQCVCIGPTSHSPSSISLLDGKMLYWLYKMFFEEQSLQKLPFNSFLTLWLLSAQCPQSFCNIWAVGDVKPMWIMLWQICFVLLNVYFSSGLFALCQPNMWKDRDKSLPSCPLPSSPVYQVISKANLEYVTWTGK